MDCLVSKCHWGTNLPLSPDCALLVGRGYGPPLPTPTPTFPSHILVTNMSLNNLLSICYVSGTVLGPGQFLTTQMLARLNGKTQ